MKTPRYLDKVVENFWRRVDDTADCWIWRGYLNVDGYGQLGYTSQDGTRLTVIAHRFAYELEVGPIPDGLHIDHLCRTKACVRPSHLEAITAQENARRRGPTAKPRSVCIHGHRKMPGRRCSECRRRAKAARRAQRKAAA